MKTLITALAVTAVLATSAVAKTQRTKEARNQANNSGRPKSTVHSAASTTRTPILIREFNFSFCATAEATNSPHQTNAAMPRAPFTSV